MSLLSQAGVKSLLARYQSFISGLRLIDGSELAALAASIQTAQAALSAIVGGTNATSTGLVMGLNEVTTSTGTNTDGVKLPPAIPGAVVYLNNSTANTITVFGVPNASNANATDTIQAHNSNTRTAGATGVTQATTLFAQYTCITIGAWKQGLMT